MKIHSSCEIEDFVETHLCKLCVYIYTILANIICRKVKSTPFSCEIEDSIRRNSYFASCVRYSDRAHQLLGVHLLIEDLGRRLP